MSPPPSPFIPGPDKFRKDGNGKVQVLMLDKSFNCFRCNFSRVCELSRIQKKFWSNDLHIEERGVNGRRGGGGILQNVVTCKKYFKFV